MRLRLPVLLATIAALLGAPSSTSAAGNDLGSPSVSPGTGTITTVFTMQVGYEGKFPAAAVSVAVAGLSLPMARIAGAPARGTWSVSTLLPAGTWTPTFSSSSEQGNASIVTGSAITVSGLQVPGVTPAPTGTADPPAGNPEIDEGPVSTQDPGSVDPGTAPVDEEPAADPSAEAEPIATGPVDPSPSAEPVDGTPRRGGSSDSASGPGPGGPAAGADHDPAAAPADATRTEPSEAPGAEPAVGSLDDDEPVTALVDNRLLAVVILVGLSGVAAVAVIGGALLILGRRRAAERDVPVAVQQQIETDALLERRTLRRARVRLAEDPIVAAMGVEDQVTARRERRRATRATSRLDERPTPPRH